MGKSNIPFIFENPSLNNIFIEASSCTTASKIFCFQNFNLVNIKKSNLKILLTDNASLIKITNQDINLGSIFLINEPNQTNSDLLFHLAMVRYALLNLNLYLMGKSHFGCTNLRIDLFHLD